jgi:hypothetical protein
MQALGDGAASTPLPLLTDCLCPPYDGSMEFYHTSTLCHMFQPFLGHCARCRHRATVLGRRDQTQEHGSRYALRHRFRCPIGLLADFSCTLRWQRIETR